MLNVGIDYSRWKAKACCMDMDMDVTADAASSAVNSCVC
jgi:hypothetical protein